MAGLKSNGDWLRRYQAGEHEGVWADMMVLGAAVRQVPYFDEAWEVARETMRRARHNVELIIRRLDAIGYQFWDGKQGAPVGPPRKLTFGGKVIEASPLEALLAALFEEARKLPPAQLTPVMLDQLRNIYQLVMFPWQDRALLFKGQWFPLDAEMRALFDQAKKLPSGQLTAATMERLYTLHRSALDQAIAYWREKGEDPPALREKKEAEERRRQQAQSADHLKDKKVFCPPVKKDVSLIRKMEKDGAFLPLSLRAWIEEVGDVNLAGAHPALCFWEDENFPGIYADPLMVSLDHFMFESGGWLEAREEGDDPGMMEPVVGWDAEAKARLAVADEQLDYGYSIQLPDAAADAMLDGEPHKTTFVNYLRIAFRWGGFPGWERQEKRPERELNFLTEGLLPI
jgi:hypothetical protein